MKNTLYFLMLFMVFGCGNTKSFTEQEDLAYQQLQALVNSRQVKINSDWARPTATNAFYQVANTGILGPGNNASNINIQSIGNNLTIKGDTVVAYLPYYGEQNFGGTPGSNHQGIEFNTIPDDYKVTTNDAKHAVDISFKIEDAYRGNESYNVFIRLFPNNSSTMRIQSSNRTAIEFSGHVKALEEDGMSN